MHLSISDEVIFRFLCFLLRTLNQLCFHFCSCFWNIVFSCCRRESLLWGTQLRWGRVLLTLTPREICSLSSWTQRASVGNLSGKSPATDWCNYLGRAILLLKWRLFWHFPVQLKLFLKLHRLNKTSGLIKKLSPLWTLLLQVGLKIHLPV